MDSAVDVIGFGAMNLDEIAVVLRIVVDGETRVRELRRRPGGSAANTVYALAKLGMTTGYVGAVGDDTEGRALVGNLASVDVDTGLVAVKHGIPSGLVRVIADSTHRSLYVYPGANDLLNRRDVHLSSLSRARVLHLTSFVNPKQLALQVWAVRRIPTSVKVSFAPGTLYAERGIAALRPILQRTTLLFVNAQEARLLTGRRNLRAAAEVLLRLGCGIVAITLGAGEEESRADSAPLRGAERGSRGTRSVRAACYVTDGQVVEILPPIVRGRHAIDTIGAGDAFAAGFLTGILKGNPLPECARLGQLMAFCSLRAPGAREGLPTLRGLREAYRQHFGLVPI